MRADDEPSAERRWLLATLARNPKRRVVGPRCGLPHEWRPETVLSPDSGLPFTPAAAWLFIADLLEGGHPCRVATLREPPGVEAYEFLVDLSGNDRTVYIKIHLGLGGKVIGRSFHASTQKTRCGAAPRRARRDDEE